MLPDAFVPLCGSDKGIETAIRVLSEKGVLSEHISIQKMLNELEKREDTFDKGCLFNGGKVLDEKEFGGSQLIRATIFAYAGIENKEYYFTKWSTYTGLALEKDWRTEKRRMCDLTFRSLLILYYSEQKTWKTVLGGELGL